MIAVVRKFGWKCDVPDQRDWKFKKLVRLAVSLPKSVDLRANCSPVEDQGELGSCTANALAGALEYLEEVDKVKFEDISRLFIYYNERELEGTLGEDSGATLRDGIKTLADKGVCAESMWPYIVSRFVTTPDDTCYTYATNHKVSAYYRIDDLLSMRNCLAQGFPFVFGFTVYESFQSKTVAKKGIIPLPKSSERALGGHAVMACGYDDAKKRFLIRNSWGADWGLRGYFWIPYSYLENRDLSDDFWCVTRAEGY